MTFWYFAEHLIQLTSTGSWYEGNFHVKTQVFVSYLAWFGFFCQLGLETFIKFGSGHFYRTEPNKPNHRKTAEPNPNRTEPKCSVEHYPAVVEALPIFAQCLACYVWASRLSVPEQKKAPSSSSLYYKRDALLHLLWVVGPPAISMVKSSKSFCSQPTFAF